jgi:hypothetical protein
MSGLASLIDPDAQLEQLADGLVFTEGPAWNPVERALVFSDIPGDAWYRWTEERGCELIAAPTLEGNGMTYEADGSLLVCEHVSSQLVRFRPDGHRDVVRDGSIYFNDPNYGRLAGAFGWERACDLDFQGVFRVPTGGADTELVDPGEFEQPNDSPRTEINGGDRQGQPRRDGVRRARQRVVLRRRWDLGRRARRRAPGHRPRPGGLRAPCVGRGRPEGPGRHGVGQALPAAHARRVGATADG